MSTETKIAKVEKNIADSVLSRVNQFQELGELRLPKDYNAGNALKSAWLILQEAVDKEGKPVLTVCSKDSIANSLFEMVVTGLSPMKKQCAFVAYGGKLTLVREYPGTIALAKRFGGVKDVTANCIYKGDEFKYEIDPNTGRRKVTSHKQDFKNVDVQNNLLGAYATLILQDGSVYTEIMNMNQIRAAWNQGHAKGNSPAHKNFPDQMAIKTVIGRACKLIINSSDDGALMGDDYDVDPVVKASNETIRENANTEDITFGEVDQEVEETIQNVQEEKPEEVQNGRQTVKPDF